MRFPHDRVRAVVARGMLRTILAAQLGTFPAGLTFRYSSKGKPSLPDADGVRVPFSVSHSGDWVLIGVGGAGRVGVDIERLRPLRDLGRIAERYFAPREIDSLRRVPDDARLGAFYSGWTAKEAYVKAVGGGISHGFHTFAVAIDGSVPPAILEIDGSETAAENWTVWAGEPAPGYRAAAVIDLPTARIIPRIWTGSGGVQPW
jgi:4'-phosphopantetheinyl transferase